jgi:hypothetical protein
MYTKTDVSTDFLFRNFLLTFQWGSYCKQISLSRKFKQASSFYNTSYTNVNTVTYKNFPGNSHKWFMTKICSLYYFSVIISMTAVKTLIGSWRTQLLPTWRTVLLVNLVAPRSVKKSRTFQRDLKVHCCAHKKLPLVPTLIQINPV